MNDLIYQQETDLSIALTLAAHTTRQTFIDVGAEKGGYSRALMNLGFRGVLFEPYPPHLANLQELVSGTASRVFPFAIDEADHDGLLHLAVDSDGKSMDYFHSLHHDDSNPIARHAGTTAVSCRSLASLAKEGLVDVEVGILKIDTEGSDLNVIRGMGGVKAEVLICEFVTPSLYPTWESSFPEGLVEAAFAKGYEVCIAVKRFGPHELVTLGRPVFVDGQWGNLIFVSNALLELAGQSLRELALRAEKKHVTALAEGYQSLEAKEQVIQTLNGACIERLAVIEQLNNKIEKQRTKEAELRAKIEDLQKKIAIMQTKP
ncbi:MAG: FkbM family methyltransferase [Verrucomicrobiaceae bacterium]